MYSLAMANLNDPDTKRHLLDGFTALGDILRRLEEGADLVEWDEYNNHTCLTQDDDKVMQHVEDLKRLHVTLRSLILGN